MRTHVRFHHPAEFVRLSDADGVLAIGGAQWFVLLLRRVPGLVIDDELCQEDWGVVMFAQRDGRRFWIGLNLWDEHEWLAHIHHNSFSWLQRLSPSGKSEMKRLLSDLHGALTNDPAVSNVRWYEKRDMLRGRPHAFASPLSD
jgi:hypothetical protein